MSIEQLKEDFRSIVGALPTGPLTTAADMAGYLKNNLLPFIESTVNEIEDMDGTIEDLVTQTPDVLHEESATVFVGIITGGLAMAKELEDLAAKTGDSQRLKPMIKEWRDLAEQGSELLEDITIPDPDPDPDPDASDPPLETPSPGAKA